MIARKNISNYNYSCQKYHEYVNSLLYCLSKNVEIILKVVIFCPFVLYVTKNGTCRSKRSKGLHYLFTKKNVFKNVCLQFSFCTLVKKIPEKVSLCVHLILMSWTHSHAKFSATTDLNSFFIFNHDYSFASTVVKVRRLSYFEPLRSLS